MNIKEKIISIIIICIAIIGMYNLYKRKLLIIKLKKYNSLEIVDKFYDFMIFFKKRSTETIEEKKLRMETNISSFIIAIGFLVISVLALMWDI